MVWQAKLYMYDATDDAADTCGCDANQSPLVACNPASYNGQCSTMVKRNIFGDSLPMAIEGVISDEINISCLSFSGNAAACTGCP